MGCPNQRKSSKVVSPLDPYRDHAKAALAAIGCQARFSMGFNAKRSGNMVTVTIERVILKSRYYGMGRVKLAQITKALAEYAKLSPTTRDGHKVVEATVRVHKPDDGYVGQTFQPEVRFVFTTNPALPRGALGGTGIVDYVEMLPTLMPREASGKPRKPRQLSAGQQQVADLAGRVEALLAEAEGQQLLKKTQVKRLLASLRRLATNNLPETKAKQKAEAKVRYLSKSTRRKLVRLQPKPELKRAKVARKVKPKVVSDKPVSPDGKRHGGKQQARPNLVKVDAVAPPPRNTLPEPWPPTPAADQHEHPREGWAINLAANGG